MKTWCKTACFIGTSVTIMLWTILRCRRLWKMATMMCRPPAPHPLYYHKQRRLIVRLCARHRRFMKKVAQLWLHTTRLSSANIHKPDELPVAPLAANRTQPCDRTRANQTASCRLKRSERKCHSSRSVMLKLWPQSRYSFGPAHWLLTSDCVANQIKSCPRSPQVWWINSIHVSAG